MCWRGRGACLRPALMELAMTMPFDGSTYFRGLIPDLAQRLPLFTVTEVPVDPELISLFLEQLEHNLRDVRGALAPMDSKTLQRVAHSLKGVGGTVGSPEVSVLAEELERAVAAGAQDRCRMLVDGLAQWEAAYRAVHNN